MRGGSRYKWWVVAMLWFVCLFNYADRQAIFSVFPVLKSQLGLSDVQLGYVASSFMWVYALAGPLAGFIGDRLRRKTVIVAGLIFWSLITIATALAVSYGQLITFRALEGLGEAFYFPASMSMLSAYHGRDTRSRAMSWHQSSVYAGTIAGGAVAGYLAERFGWQAGFWVFGSLGVLLGFVLMAFLREPAAYEKQPAAPGIAQSAVALARNRMVLLFVSVFIGANFVAIVFLTWLPSYLNRTFHMSLAMAGLNATAYLQIAQVIGVLTGGTIADKLAIRHPAGRMMTMAAGLLGGVPFLLLTGWALSVPTFIAAMIGFGFFKGLYDANLWASLHDVVQPELRATAVGVTNSLGWLGGGIAPVAIAAASARYGMSACLSATSAIYAFFGIILLIAIADFPARRA